MTVSPPPSYAPAVSWGAARTVVGRKGRRREAITPASIVESMARPKSRMIPSSIPFWTFSSKRRYTLSSAPSRLDPHACITRHRLSQRLSRSCVLCAARRSPYAKARSRADTREQLVRDRRQRTRVQERLGGARYRQPARAEAWYMRCLVISFRSQCGSPSVLCNLQHTILPCPIVARSQCTNM